jgi:hypothetical protein
LYKKLFKWNKKIVENKRINKIYKKIKKFINYKYTYIQIIIAFLLDNKEEVWISPLEN